MIRIQNKPAWKILTALIMATAMLLAGGGSAGAAWTSLTTGTTNGLEGLTCTDANTCYAVGYSGTIIKTIDGGTSWTLQVSGTANELRSVSCPVDANTCYVSGASGVMLKTTDGGANWTAQTTGSIMLLYSVHCVDVNTCYATGNSATPIKTTDGGANWASVTDTGTGQQLFSIKCVDANTCYASGSGGTITKTTNGGASWTTQTSGAANTLNALTCPTSTDCFVSGILDTIVKTSNGGSSWTLQTSGTAGNHFYGAHCLSNATTCFVVGNSGKILSTTDGGATWTDAQSGTTIFTFFAIHCLDANTCYASAQAGKVYKSPADTAPPTQSAWSPAAASSLTTTSQAITLTLNESGDCKWSLTDQTYAAMTNACADTDATHKSCAVTGLTNGAVTVSIACRDAALNADSNTSNTDLNYTVTADTAPPTQSAWSPAAASSLTTTSQAITLTLNESGDCKWSLADQTYAAMTNACADTDATNKSCSATGLAQGANTVSIACRDTALNEDSATTNTDLAYTVDSLPPTQSAWNPAGGSTLTTTSQAITVTLNESGDCKWSLTDQTYAAMSNSCADTDATHKSCSVTGLAQGANTVSIACRDAALNADSATTNTDLAYTVDSLPPTQSAWNPAGGSTLTATSQAITLTLNESGDCKWSLTDQTYSAMTNACANTDATHISCAAAGLPEGPAAVSIACRDTALNADTALSNSDMNYTIDTTPPAQSGWSPASGSSLSAAAQNVSFTTNENGSCRWAASDLAYDSMTNNCSGAGTTSHICAVALTALGANTLYIACSDANGVKDTAASNTPLSYSLDTNAPVFSFVNDGTGADQSYSTSATSLSANWSAAATSGIGKYEYAIGTTAGGTDLVSWTDNGANTSVTTTGVSITNGITYYFTIKAHSNAGATSVMSSNGAKVDSTAPSAPIVTDAGNTTTDHSKLSFSFVTADAETGLAKVEYAIGTATDKTDARDWTVIGAQTDITATGLSLSPGIRYYILVRAENAAGLVSAVGSSDGVTRVNGARVAASWIPAELKAAAGNDADVSIPLELIIKESGGVSIAYSQMKRSFVLPDGTTIEDPVTATNFSVQANQESHTKTVITIPARIVRLAMGGVTAADVLMRITYTGVDAGGNDLSTVFEFRVRLDSSESAVPFKIGGVTITSPADAEKVNGAVEASAKITTSGVGSINGEWTLNGKPVGTVAMDIFKSGDSIVTTKIAGFTEGANTLVLRITSPEYWESNQVSLRKTAAVSDFWAGWLNVTDVSAVYDSLGNLTGTGKMNLPLLSSPISIPLDSFAISNIQGKNFVSGAIFAELEGITVEKGPVKLVIDSVMLTSDSALADGSITLKGMNGVPGIGPLYFYGLPVKDNGYEGEITLEYPQTGRFGKFKISMESMTYSITKTRTDVKVNTWISSSEDVLFKQPFVIEAADSGMKMVGNNIAATPSAGGGAAPASGGGPGTTSPAPGAAATTAAASSPGAQTSGPSATNTTPQGSAAPGSSTTQAATTSGTTTTAPDSPGAATTGSQPSGSSAAGSPAPGAPSGAGQIKDFWAGWLNVAVTASSSESGGAMSGKAKLSLPLLKTPVSVSFKGASISSDKGKNVVSGPMLMETKGLRIEKGQIKFVIDSVQLKSDSVVANGSITLAGMKDVPDMGPLKFRDLPVNKTGYEGTVAFDNPQPVKLGKFSISTDKATVSLTADGMNVKLNIIISSSGDVSFQQPFVMEATDSNIKFGGVEAK